MLGRDDFRSTMLALILLIFLGNMVSAQGFNEGITYRNVEYRFSVTLPLSWEGYSVIEDKWRGFVLDEDSTIAEPSGPLILIRHPLWSEDNIRQDIPIMVFTHEQWELMQAEQFHIGAAPMNPKELDRNAGYVFALPARYNYAFPTGYEEVNQIIEAGSLRAED